MFLHPPIISSFLSQNILLNTLFLDTFSPLIYLQKILRAAFYKKAKGIKGKAMLVDCFSGENSIKQ
jgi:hypothetical protein